MTHLEILADRIEKMATTASELGARYREQQNVFLEGAYSGEVTAFRICADLLRFEAAEREGIDKEVSG